MAGERLAAAQRAGLQIATAIRADTIEIAIGAIRAEGALERTDERACLIGRQVGIAAFAIRAHLQHGAILLQISVVRFSAFGGVDQMIFVGLRGPVASEEIVNQIGCGLR